MILGIGNDLVDIRRIEKELEQFGERFKDRVFTKAEQTYADSKPNPAATYAKRFAAKEACLKALGNGHQDGVYLKDVEVVNDENGAPSIRLSGGAAKKLEALTPSGMKPKIFLSLSDEYHYAQAFVVIEAI